MNKIIIGLAGFNESIEIDTASNKQPSGEISLYEATMWETEPIILYNRD